MKFVFWNIKKKPIAGIVSDVVREHNVEVVVLAECIDEAAILRHLNAETDNLFHLTHSRRTRVVIYTRFPREYVQSEYHGDYLTVRRISLPLRRELLLAAIHFPSKRYMSDSDQAAMASRVSEEIRSVESRVGHSRTVLVGDLNMNPFDIGMVSSNGLHAVMTRQIARKQSRTVRKSSYPYFYNPMWGRLGDETVGPPGTYYRASSSFVEYFWHTFDQVLIRPDLLDSFDSTTMRVLTKSGRTRFVRSSGIPEASRVSDHLPLVFALKT